MRQFTTLIGALTVALLVGSPAAPDDTQVDRGEIRLGAADAETAPGILNEQVEIEEPRRGFDYDGLESRLESLWFQRKALLASEEDAALQLEKIRALCAEEGVNRQEHLAGALVAEAKSYFDEGNSRKALSALRYAEAFDPGRSQIHLARASVHWTIDRDVLAAGLSLGAAARTSVMDSVRDLKIFHRLAFVLGLAAAGTFLAFSLLMLVRHQTAFRHEVEEWTGEFLGGRWPVFAGWLLLALPIISWVGAGWAGLYWLVVTYRFMVRSERTTTLVVCVLGMLWLPAFSLAVSLYGTTADPSVRATLTSVEGEYDPNRIFNLRRLVESHPDDPVYRFLLADQYKNGRYFEEAFAEYQQIIVNDPSREVYINVGNIFYMTGQLDEAITNYNRALEIEPASFLAHFNLHIAQSADFRFTDADDSLQRARMIDGDRVADLLSSGEGWDAVTVQDASLNMGSLWDAALGGRGTIPVSADGGAGQDPASGAGTDRLLNAFTMISLAALSGCLLLGFVGRHSDPARRCIRCGKPFCGYCKSGREAREYCSQCKHLYVLRDGLAPRTKSRKLYEVARFERRTRRTRSLLSLVLPGAEQVLRTKPARGLLLILAWCAAWAAAKPDSLPVNDFAGLNLAGDVLAGSTVAPAAFVAGPLALLALVMLPTIWILGNLWQRRGREV